MKPRKQIIIETLCEFDTYGKEVEIIWADGKREKFVPKPIPQEESEQSKRIRAEVYGEFRHFGSMPILWKDMK